MKSTKYILAIITSATLLACNDHIVYPDPLGEPAKSLGIFLEDVEWFTILPNGSVAMPNHCNNTNAFVVTTVKRDGTCISSDTVDNFVNFASIIANQNGDIIVADHNYDDNVSSICKINQQGKITPLNSAPMFVPLTLFNNGDVAYFHREIINTSGEEHLVMHILGNNLTYIMEYDFTPEDVTSFNNNMILYNHFGEYCIYNTNGTMVANGNIESPIYTVTFVDGSLYLLVWDGLAYSNSDSDAYNGLYNYRIIKMNPQGQQLFTTKIVSSKIFSNFTVHNDMLIATGVYIPDYNKNVGNGVIYLFDNNNGQLKDTISVDYKGCDILPFYVSPDKNGEYDVYSIRRENYTEIPDYQHGIANFYQGDVFMYHTNDLHNLQIENY